MKKAYLGIIPALAMGGMLAGCEPTDYEDPAATAADQADIDSQARNKMAEEEKELKTELAKMQAKDPAVKDMYYSYSDSGEKQVHIVREEKDPKTGESRMADTVMPMVAGMLLGQMLANNMMMTAMMMSNTGGYNNTRYYSPSAHRQYRNSSTANYVSRTRSNVSRSFVSSRPTSSFSARSAGSFKSSSSSRSSGYSSGG